MQTSGNLRDEFGLNLPVSVSDVMEDLYNWMNPKTNKHSPMISEKTYKIITNNADVSNLVSFWCLLGRWELLFVDKLKNALFLFTIFSIPVTSKLIKTTWKFAGKVLRFCQYEKVGTLKVFFFILERKQIFSLIFIAYQCIHLYRKLDSL